MNTPEGRRQQAQTIRKRFVNGKYVVKPTKRGDDFFAVIGAKGGKTGGHPTPMRDPSYASILAKIRWLNYKLANGVITQQEYNERYSQFKVQLKGKV